ncbi:hypothetical protein Slin15195_G123520 [Septoria linicola]|uniref:Uncharacterized protein n=1 Tax=Septoria linicola TaxID=215465 RepID=A0A9Q9B4Y0_9PEZI|nr:hypothetical protein Slin14017_G079720 [Septoria linicola]USW59033.1 hypothetical protein Slin15195_G123520 [Septoria linicola]
MFGTFLLASFAGAGAASVISPDLNARANYPPSYLCNSASKKCSQPKQQASVTAYCSSYLKVPKTNAQYYGGGGGYGGIAKPSCLSAYKNTKSISSACSCFSIKPKATTTTTVTKQKTDTTVIKTDTTVTATATTTFVRGTDLPFLVADYNVNFFDYGIQGKGEQSGIARDVFGTNSISTESRAVLFALNAASGRLTTVDAENEFRNGQVAVQYTNPNDPEAELRGIETSRVVIADPDNVGFATQFTPITCSISQNPVNLTCPLTCGVQRGDVNQVGTVGGGRRGTSLTPWYLGQIGEKSSDPYVTYAVSRTVVEGGEPEEGEEGGEEMGGD